MADRIDDRSLGELFAELSRETGTLIRKEVELAKTELSTSVSRLGRNAGMIAAGGALLYAALLLLLGSLAFGLAALGVALWLAILIVALLAAGGGYLLVTGGLKAARRTNVTPVQTLETMKENARWAKGQRA